MPRIYVMPHAGEEQLFSDVASLASDTQSDFRFHTLPPNSNPDCPLTAVSSDFKDILNDLQQRKNNLGIPNDDLFIAFYNGRLQAREYGLSNLFVAGARYDEPMPCTAVVSLNFLDWDVLDEKYNYTLQKHSILHLFVCCIIGAYTHLEAHHATCGCLLDFDSNLSDFNRKLARGYYLCNSRENGCLDVMNNERYGSSIIKLCSTLKYKADRDGVHIQIGEVVMGDTFRDIKNSTIVNKSKIVDALNTLGPSTDRELESAMVQLANHVADSSNPAAGAIFDSITDELAKPEKETNKLKQLWQGLTEVLPSVAKLGDATAKITSLFL